MKCLLLGRPVSSVGLGENPGAEGYRRRPGRQLTPLLVAALIALRHSAFA